MAYNVTCSLKSTEHLTSAIWMLFAILQAWPLEDVSSGTANPVERKCSQAAVTALCYSVQDKLFVGIKQEIQVLMLSRNN